MSRKKSEEIETKRKKEYESYAKWMNNIFKIIEGYAHLRQADKKRIEREIEKIILSSYDFVYYHPHTFGLIDARELLTDDNESETISICQTSDNISN